MLQLFSSNFFGSSFYLSPFSSAIFDKFATGTAVALESLSPKLRENKDDSESVAKSRREPHGDQEQDCT